jgi:hypothetical protein
MSSSSSLPFTSLALSMQVMHVKSVSQMVPHDTGPNKQKLQRQLMPEPAVNKTWETAIDGHRGALPGGQLPNASPPLKSILSAFIPTPLCGWYANCLKVLAHCGDKGLGKATPGVLGTTQTQEQRLTWVPLLRHPSHVSQPWQPSLGQKPPRKEYLALAPQMLKVVAVNNADPQNLLQAVAIHSLQPIPLCLRQRPCLTTIDKVRNDKRAKNLHLGFHQKVAIPTHMG